MISSRQTTPNSYLKKKKHPQKISDYELIPSDLWMIKPHIGEDTACCRNRQGEGSYPDTGSPPRSTVRWRRTPWHETPPACNHGYTWRWPWRRRSSRCPAWFRRGQRATPRMRWLDDEIKTKHSHEHQRSPTLGRDKQSARGGSRRWFISVNSEERRIMSETASAVVCNPCGLLFKLDLTGFYSGCIPSKSL